MNLLGSEFVDSLRVFTPDGGLFVKAEFIEGGVYGVDPFPVIGSKEADGPV